METPMVLFSLDRLKALLPKRHMVKKPDHFRRMQELAQAQKRLDKIRLALDERIRINNMR